MKVTYFGTTMLLFNDGKDQVLFDCHVTRPSLLKCFAGDLNIDKKTADQVLKDYDFSRLRAIFVSHSHHDHVMDMPYFARKTGCAVYGSSSTLNVARGGKVKEELLHEFSLNAAYAVGAFKIRIIPSIHSKAHWYNDDLGQTIDEPIKYPARKKDFKEGGSFDFYVEHKGKKIVIRPSYNYIKGQWDGMKADVLFLGIAGISKDSEKRKTEFFAETIEKLGPSLVIPVHWDNFFVPLYGKIKGQPSLMEDTGKSIYELARYCGKHDISCVVQPPLTSFEI